ncbi:hypothetical protein B7R22_12155 [Subtercola boreus]|uniref:Uncharacterized protein n=1 Tax=Subtercola boreus TaxID=120213 RepID=A0A3E0VV08_9MICO|nr:DUF6350 family protein [Subtercola boreus]RFA13425.1 hypothetical protein B7R22_12155 [Subtercola boreus]
MNRPTTALLAALDALIAVAIGIGIPLVMLTILWATQFDLSIDWTVFWRASADLWMLGNGVDLQLALDPALAARLALDGAATPFVVGIAPLGFAVLTAFLGRRSGLRLGFSPHPVLGLVVGVATVGVLGALAWLSAETPGAVPSFWQAVLLVPAVYGLGMVIGAAASLTRQQSPLAGWFLRQWERMAAAARPFVAVALRGGAIVVAAMVAVGALAVTAGLLVHYSSVISLYESLGSGIGGGAALTLGQLALLPNAVVWAASWFVGPGFALGAGSSISPLGTDVGLLPSLPLFGALPQSSPLGYAVLVLPVAIGFVIAVALRPRLVAPGAGAGGQPHGAGAGAKAGASAGTSAARMIGTGFGIGIVAASILAVLALWSGGAAGPGRLAVVGPDPGAVWLWSFIVFGVSATVGLLASGVELPGRRTNGSARGSDTRGTSTNNGKATSTPTASSSASSAPPASPSGSAPLR